MNSVVLTAAAPPGYGRLDGPRERAAHRLDEVLLAVGGNGAPGGAPRA